MIPFENSLPYDIQMNEVYASECPFCGRRDVRLPIKPKDVAELAGGQKKLSVLFNCCHTRLQLIDADSDYLLADRAVRR